ncbi:hypothetical protein F2Q69_00036710 [Brassica cretica]|uniref:Uncharacterized protein n=1 Tax=Brassica cretica TaxID=69181 RepID=A0A8S9SEL5_BRACR|nr:hypothetical protein F2Q69_00036710 [Brassica cretica]
MNDETDEVATRPPGVKASKGLAKNKAETEYQRMWNIKKEDMAMRDRLLQMKLLDNLLAKTEPLVLADMCLLFACVTDEQSWSVEDCLLSACVTDELSWSVEDCLLSACVTD